MNRLFRWGIVIALLVLVVSGLMAIRIIFVDDNETDVPHLIGMSAVDATNSLQNVGLSARIDLVDSDQSKDTVISQVPTSGNKVERGKIVTIKVSRGGTQTQIPDVRGMEFSEAVKTLDASGFKTGTVTRVTDNLKPSGTVIAQNPASPALVLNNRMVELLVSEGAPGRAEMVVVPDMKGQTEKLARQILEQSDLSVAKIITVESNQVPVGSVLRTQPRAGSRVPHGNAVTLYLAKEVASTPPQETQPPGSGISTQPETRRNDSPSQPAQPTQPQQPNPTPETPAPTQPTATSPTPAAGTQKTAKIRYQVPPLSRALPLKITINDQLGTRVLRDQQARGGEYITMDIGYTGKATVTVQLDNTQVWQDKYE